MFEWVNTLFRKGGANLGVIDKIDNILDHPRLNLKQEDVDRIRKNMMHYKGDYPEVKFVNSNGEKTSREYHSINITKVVARKLAKLVFNEGVHITIEKDEKDNAFIQEVLRDSKFLKSFGEELEAGYAIGGLVIRPYYDSETNSIQLKFTKPDAFYPIHSGRGDTSAMCFPVKTELKEGDKKVYYTLLEFHYWKEGKYYIENELWRSEEKSKLGIRWPLNSIEKYKNLKPISYIQNASRSLFVYIKLAGKNNRNLYSPLGLGVVDNSRRQIKDINDKYDQFMTEIEEGGRKIMASEHFFRTKHDMNTARPITNFDKNTSVFRTIRSDEPLIQEFVPSLRSEEFISSIDFILRVIEMQTGLSAGTFSFDGNSVKTATEVVSEDSESYSTRSDNVSIVEEAIKELITTIFELAEAHGLYKKPKKIETVIDFDDGVFQSQDKKLEFYGKATTFGLNSKVRSIMALNKCSKEVAIEILNEIRLEEMGFDPVEQAEENEKAQFGPKE